MGHSSGARPPGSFVETLRTREGRSASAVIVRANAVSFPPRSPSLILSWKIWNWSPSLGSMLVFRSRLRRMMARWSNDSLHMCVRSVRWMLYKSDANVAEINRGGRCAPADADSGRGFQDIMMWTSLVKQIGDFVCCWPIKGRISVVALFYKAVERVGPELKA